MISASSFWMRLADVLNAFDRCFFTTDCLPAGLLLLLPLLLLMPLDEDGVVELLLLALEEADGLDAAVSI